MSDHGHVWLHTDEGLVCTLGGDGSHRAKHFKAEPLTIKVRDHVDRHDLHPPVVRMVIRRALNAVFAMTDSAGDLLDIDLSTIEISTRTVSTGLAVTVNARVLPT